MLNLKTWPHSPLGFNVVKGVCLNSLEPMTDKNRENIEKSLDRQSRRFYSGLIKIELPSPSLFKLTMFRMARTSVKLALNESDRDYHYYQGKGWFNSDYFYPVKLNPFKKLIGNVSDRIAKFSAARNGTI